MREKKNLIGKGNKELKSFLEEGRLFFFRRLKDEVEIGPNGK